MGDKNTYLLRNFSETEPPQNILFYEMAENGSMISNGTTIEEMLRVSIERLTDLNIRFAYRENSIAITKMQEALMWLNARTADRKERGVEGKHQA